MSDPIGDCDHSRGPEWCVQCLRAEVAQLMQLHGQVCDDAQRLTERAVKAETEFKRMLLACAAANEEVARLRELINTYQE